MMMKTHKTHNILLTENMVSYRREKSQFSYIYLKRIPKSAHFLPYAKNMVTTVTSEHGLTVILYQNPLNLKMVLALTGSWK